MIAIGCDHAGLELKKCIMDHFAIKGQECKDFGAFSKESVDYPDIAYEVAEAVVSGQYEFGVLICGTGIGISIAANKVKGIRAALCNDPVSARLTKEHNDANIICMGARIIGEGTALAIIDAYTQAEFMGAQHSRRIAKISNRESRGY